MKNKFTVFLMCVLLFCTLGYSKETVLLKSDTDANYEDYSWANNFEIKSSSGYFTEQSLKILEPNEKGFRFYASNVPMTCSTHYEIYPAYPAFLNDSDVGAGYIDNVSNIKSIKIIATTNRPYDEIILLYSTSPNGSVKEIKMPQDFNAIHSMEEFELEYNNLAYIDDVTKRELKSSPVLSDNNSGIYFRGIKIKTNAPSGTFEYSGYSVFYLKQVSVIYDEAFTEEQIEAKKLIKEEFGIKDNVELENKTKSAIKEKKRLRDEKAKLKHTQE